VPGAFLIRRKILRAFFRSKLIVGVTVVVFVLLSAAAVLAATYGFEGTISSPYEKDEFKFIAQAGDSVRATLVCDDLPTLDPYLEIHGPDTFYIEDDDSGRTFCGGHWSSALSFIAPATGEYTAIARDYSDGVGSYKLCIKVSDSGDQCFGTNGTKWFEPGDDRINRQAYAAAAIYCDAENSQLVVYGIDAKGNGQQTIVVPYADLPETPADSNALITQQGGVSVYRLVSGEYQLVGAPDAEGKQYVAVWDGCPYTYLNAYILQNGVLTQTESNTP
jgi:hypothetical protein